MAQFADYRDLARPFTLVVPALGVLVGFMAAFATADFAAPSRLYTPDNAIAFAILLLSFPAALLNAASNALNQIFDLRIDAIAKPDRPLPSGRLSLRGVWVFTVVTYLLAMSLVAVASVMVRNFRGDSAASILFGVFATGLLMTLLYSVPPLRLKRFGWVANITIAIPRGLLLPLAGWCFFGDVANVEGWLLGATPGLFLVGAAATKDFADAEADASDGVRTLPVTLGFERAVKRMVPFLVLPFLIYPVLANLASRDLIQLELHANGTVLIVAGLVLATWGVILARILLKDPHALSTRGENHPAWKHMYLMMIAYYLSLGAAYIVGT